MPIVATAICLVLCGATMLLWRKHAGKAASAAVLLVAVVGFSLGQAKSVSAAEVCASSSPTNPVVVPANPVVVPAVVPTPVVDPALGSNPPVPPPVVPEAPLPVLLGLGTMVVLGLAIGKQRGNSC
jgi:hypothetical protein